LISIPKIMDEAIKEKGKAELGDKTILDALIRMSEVIQTEFEQARDLKESKGSSGRWSYIMCDVSRIIYSGRIGRWKQSEC